jgi:hypothetical protein
LHDMIPASLMNFRALSLLLLVGSTVATGADSSFETDVEPLLRTRCWKCHGTGVQLARLNLQTREGLLAGGEHGAVVIAGKPQESKLFRMVAGLDKPAMPMDGKLSAAEVEVFRKWIAGGAPWGESKQAPAVELTVEDMKLTPEARNWWAFRKPVRPEIPVSANPVDYLVAKRRGQIAVAPQAGKLKLVRRAYLDLIGLPPTPAQVAEFVNDTAAGAWERLVERLLASPHYGERWGRHWLDLARYADSNGYEHDYDRPNAWRYRDYVIAAFNADKPYDRFLAEQLAGDEVADVSPETLTATGFLRSHAKVGYREKDNPEFRYEYLDDMIATVGRGVMGLTVQCARCHDHKFDPIGQKDYYRLQASLFGYVEVDHPLVPADKFKAENTRIDALVQPLRREVREIEQPYRDQLLPLKYKKYPENVQAAIRTPEAERTAGQVLLANQVIRTTSVSSNEIDRVAKPEDLARKRALLARIAEFEKQRPAPIPMAMGITDGDYRSTPDGPGDEPAPGKGLQKDPNAGPFLHEGPGRYVAPPSYFLISGDVHSRGPHMEPGFPAVLVDGSVPTALPPENGKTSGRRLALAKWLGSSENPLTARVMVNRIWHHHFGTGIVKSIDNFGKMGELPSNPELLDYLATEFVRKGWSIKSMHRLILGSKTYQMDSSFDDVASAAKDPRNEMLWRFPVHRLEAEVVRDSILAAAGTLNPTIGGPAVFPVLEPDVLRAMTHGIWKQDKDGPEVWRRSVYVYRKRGLPFPMFEVFDLPDQNVSCGARNTSTVPTQALTLLNNGFVLQHARHLASFVREARPGDVNGQIELAYQRVLGRGPSGQERALAVDFLKAQPLEALGHVLLNLNEFLYIQ